VDVKVADIETMDNDQLEEMLIRSQGVIVGSPTINQNTLMPVYSLFALINPIRDRGKMAGAFGSYGWSGEASKIILENLKLLKLNVFEENVPFKFSPEGAKEEILKDYGRRFGRKFKEFCG
jgi:flavorubredoxin